MGEAKIDFRGWGGKLQEKFVMEPIISAVLKSTCEILAATEMTSRGEKGPTVVMSSAPEEDACIHARVLAGKRNLTAVTSPLMIHGGMPHLSGQTLPCVLLGVE